MNWLTARPEGIYLPGIDTWIDPSVPAAKALVTHGHADHARGGHGKVWATPETLAIMGLRYGLAAETGSVCEYGNVAELGDGITASFHPAGHVLGSAQILLSRQGERIVVTGDYKRRPDPTCAPFEPVACDILITEATFGLPVFRHPPTEQEIATLLAARQADPSRTILVGAYALGKAQRVIAELRRAGYHETIYLHGAMERMCDLYARFGIDLGDLKLVTDAEKGEMAGAIVIAPPSAVHDRWSARFGNPMRAVASGWMQIRQRAVQKRVELPLVISDHCDWAELTQTISELRPAETWVTHGREEALIHWCHLHQLPAKALTLVGREEEDDG